MSWWTKLRDSIEKIGSLGLYDPEKSRQRDREQRQNEENQRKLINDQINAYKQESELAKKTLEETRNQTETEKRRVQEKQIRSLRRSYRRQGAGMLGQGQPATQDMGSQLGA